MQIAEELSALLGQPLNPNREENPIRCPLHDDRHASASVNLRKGVWNCQGCGSSGGIGYLAQLLGGHFDQSDLSIIRAQTALEPEEELADFSDLYRSFQELSPFHPEALAYRKEKGLSFETLQHFGIRHDGKGVLVMPYFNGNRVAAIRYRGRNNKKWYESGSERCIYNLNQVRGSEKVILCEGESDVHSMWNLWSNFKMDGVVIGGIPGANSSRATWELWSLDLMWAERIYLAFDNDEAGINGIAKAADVLGERAIALTPPEGYNDWSDAIKDGNEPRLD